MKRNEVGFKVKVLIISLGMVLLQLSVSLAADVPNKFKDGESASAEKVNANFKDLSDRAFEKSGSHINYGAGNVGIGIETPGAGLHISKAPGFLDPETTTDGTFQCPPGTTWDDKNSTGGIDLGECQENGLVVEQGNVGIGLTNPVGKLQTQDTRFDEGGNCPQGYTPGDFDGEGDVTDCRAIGVTVLANGNVGIGTLTPGAKLDVRTTSGGYGIQLGFGEVSGEENWLLGNSFYPGWGQSANALNISSSSTTGQDIFLNTVNSPDQTKTVVIKAGGNVGIGTATPQAKLEVSGSLKSNNVRVKANPTDGSGIGLEEVTLTSITGNFNGIPLFIYANGSVHQSVIGWKNITFRIRLDDAVSGTVIRRGLGTSNSNSSIGSFFVALLTTYKPAAGNHTFYLTAQGQTNTSAFSTDFEFGAVELPVR